MPGRKYALEKDQPKDLEISWGLSFKNVVVKWKGQEIGRMATKAELLNGSAYVLENGSVVKVQLVQNLRSLTSELQVTYNGIPVPGSDSDPVQKLKVASILIFMIAGLNIFSGLLVGALTDMGSAPFVICGLLFAVLGVLVRKGSLISLIITIILLVIDIITRICMGAPHTVFITLFILIYICKAIEPARKLNQPNN